MTVPKSDGVYGYQKALHRLRPQQEARDDPRFLWFTLLNAAQQGFFQADGSENTFAHLTAEKFRRYRFAFPPPEEQKRIVRFLDHADRRIRRYIRAKQRLIKLLDEQKQVIFRRAVTRGLDPNARLKPSGVEWLGDVPEHWVVGRIKSALRNLNARRVPLSGPQRGAMTTHSYDYYGASGIIDKVEDFIFDDDLLLIAEDGANLVLRNLSLAIIARGKFWVNNHAHILKPRCGALEYFAAVLECIDYSPWITGAAQPKLTQDRLMSIGIPVPPPAEQFAIMRWIAESTVNLDAGMEKARREVALLREYRTRLIADVVTGKLDVREAAAGLSDDIEGPDALDVDDTLDEATHWELSEDMSDASN